MAEIPTSEEYPYYNSTRTPENLTFLSAPNGVEYLEDSEIVEVSASFEHLLCDRDELLIPDSICFNTQIRSNPRPFIPADYVHDRTASIVVGAYKHVTLKLLHALQSWLVRKHPLWRVRLLLFNPGRVYRLFPREKQPYLDIIIYPQAVRFGDLPQGDDIALGYQQWSSYFLEHTSAYEIHYEAEFSNVAKSLPLITSTFMDVLPVRTYQFELLGRDFQRLWLLLRNTATRIHRLHSVKPRNDSREVRTSKLVNYVVTPQGAVQFQEDQGLLPRENIYLECYQFLATSPCDVKFSATDRDSEGNYTISRPPLEFPINPSDVIKHE